MERVPGEVVRDTIITNRIDTIRDTVPVPVYESVVDSFPLSDKHSPRFTVHLDTIQLCTVARHISRIKAVFVDFLRNRQIHCIPDCVCQRAGKAEAVRAGRAGRIRFFRK